MFLCPEIYYLLTSSSRTTWRWLVYNNYVVNFLFSLLYCRTALWYRFVSYAGETVVERAENDAVPMNHCGTMAPIYIQGLNSHPSVGKSELYWVWNIKKISKTGFSSFFHSRHSDCDLNSVTLNYIQLYYIDSYRILTCFTVPE